MFTGGSGDRQGKKVERGWAESVRGFAQHVEIVSSRRPTLFDFEKGAYL